MTMLCRSAGLPARLATGFAPGEQDGQTYNLRAMDKHAWTEVYFPGEGWLAFDPTVGTRTDGSIPTSTPRHHWDWQGLVRHLGAGPVALSLLILALLLYVAKTEVYDRWRARRAGAAPRRRNAPPVRSDLGRQYARMLRLMRGLGLPRHPAETPAEYDARARAFLSRQRLPAPDPATVGALTAQFIAARYGASGTPSAAQTQAAEQSLRDFAAAAPPPALGAGVGRSEGESRGTARRAPPVTWNSTTHRSRRRASPSPSSGSTCCTAPTTRSSAKR